MSIAKSKFKSPEETNYFRFEAEEELYKPEAVFPNFESLKVLLVDKQKKESEGINI